MSKPVATITFHWATNYGGVLQAYALQQAIKKLGAETEIIDFVPRRVRLMIVLSDLRSRRFSEFKKERSIASFRKEYLTLSKRHYGSVRALKKAGADYDRIISGSDQVWNYSFITSYGKKPMLSYFLDFAGESVKRFAYAVSFGANKMPADYPALVSGEVKKFSAVSVREDTGLDIVASMGVPAKVVCDPTVLLTEEDYAAVIPEQTSRAPYIYSYIIHKGQDTAHKIESAAARLLPECELIRTAPTDGVREWLAGIKGAELVVTNSFHGMMLSLILGRPFIAVPVEGHDMNARVENVLRAAGLENRLLASSEEEKVSAVINAPIDRAAVSAALEAMRKDGYAFLRSCIEG
ncbi:MAG: polysaccharide pyruvyl transferase family protein [Clostridia bacterium]|nr:polysaccharide pyruvyl transferase family protein [Clostridia bacterium]